MLGILSFCALLIACWGVPSETGPKSTQSVAPEPDSIQSLLEEKKYPQALEVLAKEREQKPSDANVYYQTAHVYGLAGDQGNAILYYRKTLELAPTNHEAYLALKSLHRFHLMQLRRQIEDKSEARFLAKSKGEPTLKTEQKDLENLFYTKARLHLSEATTYLLYEDRDSNISEFPELEAHLRDMQDIIKEMQEVRTKGEEKQKEHPLYREIHEVRSKIAQKHARTLLGLAEDFQKEGNVSRALEVLKDADAQMSKFYPEEEPTSEVILFEADASIHALYREIHAKLRENYELAWAIHARNQQSFQEIEDWQQAEEEGKLCEQMVESMISVHMSALWRYDKIKKEAAEHHESMIPLYEKFLQNAPAKSAKAGEYHYRLAQCYLQKKDWREAKEHAQKAHEILDNYRSKELLEDMLKQEGK